MRLRLLALVSGVVLLGALVGGATFALFTASSSAMATYRAGTVAVEIRSNSGNVISDADGPPLMIMNNLAPGDSATYFSRVRNSGSLPVAYNLSFMRTDDMADLENNGLASNLMMTVERQKNPNNPNNWVMVGTMTVAQWHLLGPTAWMPELEPTMQQRYRIKVELPLATGNVAQAGTNQVTFQVNAQQLIGTEGELGCNPGRGMAKACVLQPLSPITKSVGASKSHYYKIWLDAGQSAVVNVVPINPDPDLYAYDIHLDLIDSSTNPGYTLDTLTVNAPTAGYYVMEVYGWPLAGQAQYTISYHLL